MKYELSLGIQSLEHYAYEIEKRDLQDSFKKCNLDKIIDTSLDGCDIGPYEDLVKDGQV